jgi:hypothetical protein
MRTNSKRGLAAVGCGVLAAVGVVLGGCSSDADPPPSSQNGHDKTESFVGASIPVAHPSPLEQLESGFVPHVTAITCPGTQTQCGRTCSTLATDSLNCGACGNVCGDGLKCSNGECAATCGQGTLACGNDCIDPQTSQTNCGATDACDPDAGTTGDVCGSDEACVQGECYRLEPYLVGSIRVSDGPAVGAPGQLGFSCVAACANQYGDEPKDYHCSTSADSLDNKAWGSNWGSNKNCLNGDPGIPIDEGAATPSYAAPGDLSTFINDACDETSINYCWRIPPSQQKSPKTAVSTQDSGAN